MENRFITEPNPAGTTNLFLRGNPDVNNEGFGAHANWLVTINLDSVRANRFGAAPGHLQLTGLFGPWGAIGSTATNAGVVQGAIFLDGGRIDSMGIAHANPPLIESFDLSIESGSYLTFAILNRSPSDVSDTFWDDGIFQDVNLTLVPPVIIPEPQAFTLLGLGALGALMAGRRRRERVAAPRQRERLFSR